MAITRRECMKSLGAAGAAFAGWTAVSANPDERVSQEEQKGDSCYHNQIRFGPFSKDVSGTLLF